MDRFRGLGIAAISNNELITGSSAILGFSLATRVILNTLSETKKRSEEIKQNSIYLYYEVNNKLS